MKAAAAIDFPWPRPDCRSWSSTRRPLVALASREKRSQKTALPCCKGLQLPRSYQLISMNRAERGRDQNSGPSRHALPVIVARLLVA